jgi:Fe2+ or Zn2+ uptake regulation protein
MSHDQINYIATLHDSGYRMTTQRQVILDAICAADEHAPITKILFHARQIDPQLDPSTVYRAVALFVELGLVLVAMDEQGEKRYEVAKPHPHHHLHCRNCGQTLTLDSKLTDAYFRELESIHGYQIDMDHLFIEGLCPGCKRS